MDDAGPDTRQEDGPDDEPTQLLIRIRDFVIGKMEVSHKKGLTLQSKPKKLPDDPEKLREMQNLTTHGFQELKSDAFQGVGASFAARLAKKGHQINLNKN